MDVPTRENPSIFLSDGPLMVTRGYSVYSHAQQKFVFVGAFDGPLVELRDSDSTMLAPVSYIPTVILALQSSIVQPVAAEGTHDDHLRCLGLEPPPRSVRVKS